MSAAQKKRLQIHPAGLLITLLSFGAWVVALGGVGGATQNCVNGGISAATSATPGASVQCAKIYQWEWWGLWFEACLLVSLFVASFFEAFNRGKQIFISYYIMCTCVLMWGAHNFITSSQLGSTGWKISDKQQARVLRPRATARAPCAPTAHRERATRRAAPRRQSCCAAPQRSASHAAHAAARMRGAPRRFKTLVAAGGPMLTPRALCTGGEQRWRGGLHHPVHLQLLPAHHPRLCACP